MVKVLLRLGKASLRIKLSRVKKLEKEEELKLVRRCLPGEKEAGESSLYRIATNILFDYVRKEILKDYFFSIKASGNGHYIIMLLFSG